MERTVNERILDAMIIRQILLMRYSLYLRNRVSDILNNTEGDVATLIRGTLRFDLGLRDPQQISQLNYLVARVTELRNQAWVQAATETETDLSDLGDQEAEEQHNLYGAWLPKTAMAFVLFGVGRRALQTPMQGRLVRQWFIDLSADDARRIRSSIFAGGAAGEAADTIARRVVGSARARGADGVTQVSRNQLDTILRSGVVHVASRARDEFARQNISLLQEQYVAILDSRTTKICRSLNGHRYAVGVGPIPPLHMNCRSIRYAVLPEKIGGPIPEPEVYDRWIRTQPRAVQVELMGAARVARMRAGTLDPGAFTDYGNRPMTLEQIREAAKRLMP